MFLIHDILCFQSVYLLLRGRRCRKQKNGAAAEGTTGAGKFTILVKLFQGFLLVASKRTVLICVKETA